MARVSFQGPSVHCPGLVSLCLETYGKRCPDKHGPDESYVVLVVRSRNKKHVGGRECKTNNDPALESCSGRGAIKGEEIVEQQKDHFEKSSRFF